MDAAAKGRVDEFKALLRRIRLRREQAGIPTRTREEIDAEIRWIRGEDEDEQAEQKPSSSG